MDNHTYFPLFDSKKKIKKNRPKDLHIGERITCSEYKQKEVMRRKKAQ